MILRSIRDLVAGRSLTAVRPDDSVADVCDRIRALEVSALAVLDGDARLVGIVSERDVVRKATAGERPLSAIKVSEIMTSRPVTIDADRAVAEAVRRMQDNGIRHLPVTDGGRLVTVLAMTDIPPDYRLLVERGKAAARNRTAAPA